MLIKMYSVVPTVFSVLVVGINCREYMKEKPDFFKPCRTTTNDFNKCYKDNVQALVLHFKDGIPALPAVGKFEPVEIKKISLEQNQLNIDSKNLIIKGLGDTKITKVLHNPKDFSVLIKCIVPKMNIEADYKADGRILFLPLNGNGKMFFDIKNIEIVFLVNLKLQDDDNLSFADLQSVKTKIKNIEGFHVQLTNLFNGNKELEENANSLFNQNWREFVDVLQPKLEEAAESVILSRFKLVFNYIPLNYIISDVPTAKEFYG